MGVIHRDIKPQNIMRRNSDKEFILIDFGAAKSVGGLNPVQQQTAIGTPGYQAPEISQGQVYFGSDLFSLGATMVWLLARVEPSQMQGGSTNWRSYVRTPVSPMMASVLDGLLKFNPAERFQDAAGVIQFIRMHAPQVCQPIYQPAANCAALCASPVCAGCRFGTSTTQLPGVHQA